ncbi:hypothetical protein [Burkholderia ubonensis]|uniref:hypothetical protein n=1 Tax=Burkholderia ubonensis TaxID=101571 RepID=UPI000A50798F|nr:hypothetical protein [Burkholderia ubonensis]
MSMTKTAVSTARDESIAKEVAFRDKLGLKKVTFEQLKAMIRELGYRFDPRMSCKSLARYMTGERAGESYPANSLYPVQIDNGKSYANVESRRDSNWEKLKEIRNTYYAVHGGYIYEW